jgi:hypothetical protein
MDQMVISGVQNRGTLTIARRNKKMRAGRYESVAFKATILCLRDSHAFFSHDPIMSEIKISYTQIIDIVIGHGNVHKCP